MTDKHKTYLPRERTGYSPSKHSLESCSPEGITSNVPSPVIDDIVVNNIATSEFDYTEHLDIDKDLNVNSK